MRTSCTDAVRRPRRSLPSRRSYSYAGRYPTPKYVCLRVRTSFTGRFTSRAARAAMEVCTQVRPPLPKAPPTAGEMTRILSGDMPNSAAMVSTVPCTCWVFSQSVSRSPSQRATVPAGSIGLWWLRAIRYARSSVTSADSRARSASPRA